MPDIVLEAIDADVIKTYVKLGLGVGIVAEIAMREEAQGSELVSRPVGHLFGVNVARIAFKRGAYLRNFVYAFVETLSDRLSRNLVENAPCPATPRTTSYERPVSAMPAPKATTPRRRARRPSRVACLDVGTTIFTVMSALAQRARRRQPRPGLSRFRLRPARCWMRSTRRCAAA